MTDRTQAYTIYHNHMGSQSIAAGHDETVVQLGGDDSVIGVGQSGDLTIQEANGLVHVFAHGQWFGVVPN